MVKSLAYHSNPLESTGVKEIGHRSFSTLIGGCIFGNGQISADFHNLGTWFLEAWVPDGTYGWSQPGCKFMQDPVWDVIWSHWLFHINLFYMSHASDILTKEVMKYCHGQKRVSIRDITCILKSSPQISWINYEHILHSVFNITLLSRHSKVVLKTHLSVSNDCSNSWNVFSEHFFLQVLSFLDRCTILVIHNCILWTNTIFLHIVLLFLSLQKYLEYFTYHCTLYSTLCNLMHQLSPYNFWSELNDNL